MKKNYIQPIVNEVHIELQHVIAGSDDVNFGLGGTTNDPISAEGKEDDIDSWGW